MSAAVTRSAERRGSGRLVRLAMSPGMARLGVIILALVIWEVGARWYNDAMVFAPPSRVVASLGELYTDPQVTHAVLLTFWELAIAFAISVVIGLAVGVTVGLHRFSQASVYPIILLVYATPQVTILPLIVLIFGFGPESKIAFGVTHGIFPMIVTIVAGVQNIPKIYTISAQSMGASRRQILRHVVFPYMVPSFFTGMRLGMTAVLLGVLLAELYVSIGGIGYFTEVFTENFEPQKLFALIGTLAVMAIFLNEVVRRAEIRASRWRV